MDVVDANVTWYFLMTLKYSRSKNCSAFWIKKKESNIIHKLTKKLKCAWKISGSIKFWIEIWINVRPFMLEMREETIEDQYKSEI